MTQKRINVPVDVEDLHEIERRRRAAPPERPIDSLAATLRRLVKVGLAAEEGHGATRLASPKVSA